MQWIHAEDRRDIFNALFELEDEKGVETVEVIKRVMSKLERRIRVNGKIIFHLQSLNSEEREEVFSRLEELLPPNIVFRELLTWEIIRLSSRFKEKDKVAQIFSVQ